MPGKSKIHGGELLGPMHEPTTMGLVNGCSMNLLSKFIF